MLSNVEIARVDGRGLRKWNHSASKTLSMYAIRVIDDEKNPRINIRLSIWILFQTTATTEFPVIEN